MSDKDVSNLTQNKKSVLDDPRLEMFRADDGNLYMTEKQGEAVLGEGKILVSASAGSGKTSTLVKRILRMIAEGVVATNEMLVCVFNESARAELKDKLHRELFRCACNETDPVRRDRLLTSLDRLPFCRISTIHSFCSSLIRENFEKLGISPVFEVADDSMYAALKSRAIEEALDEFGNAEDEDFELLAAAFAQSRDENDVKKNVDKLYERMIVQPDVEEFKRRLVADFDHSVYLDVLEVHYKNLVRAATPHIAAMRENIYAVVDESFGYQRAFDVLLDILNSLLNAKDFLDMLKVAAFAPEIPPRNKRDKRRMSDEAYDITEVAKDYIDAVVKGLLKELNDTYAALDVYRERHAQNVRLISKLIEIAQRVDEILAKYKAERNLLSYQDLLAFAARLLKENPQLGDEFKAIFVDEYQDVDPLQESIFKALIKDECFMVGDVKQSIYGFRLADPQIFLSRQAAYKNGDGALIEFADNFRSETGILRFVNGVFESVMTEPVADVDYKRDGAFNLKREGKFAGDDKEGASPVRMCFFESGSSKRDGKKRIAKGVYDLAAHAAMQKEEDMAFADMQGYFILDQIKKIVGNVKKEDGGYISYGDIAILSRKTKKKDEKVARIIEILSDAGVPVDESKVGGDTGEAERELLSLLSAIDNPMQDIPFAGYLLSYFGGYCEQELADVSSNRGGTFYERFKAEGEKDTPLASKVRATLKTLDEYRVKAGFMSVSDLTAEIMASTGYDAYMLGKGESALAAARAFVGSKAAQEYSLGKFLENYASSDASSVGAGGDSVQMSTFHKFKGLEIPVVFVVNADSPIKEEGDDIVMSSGGLIGLKYFDADRKLKSDSLGHFAVKKLIKDISVKEEMRLMYVALTRAKQQLYVLGKSGKSFGKKIKIGGMTDTRDFFEYATCLGAIREQPEFFTKDDVAVLSGAHAPFTLNDVDEELLAKVKEGRKFKYPHAASTLLARKYSVSALTSLDDQVEALYPESSDAAKVGTAYHHVMQGIDFDATSREDVVAELDRLEREGAITPDERECVNVDDIVRAMASDVIAAARKAEKLGLCRRERSFMMLKPAREVSASLQSEDSVLVQGVIDLLIMGEKCVIVDFKYADLDRSKNLEKYKEQLQLYKMAVESAGIAKVDRLVLYSFKTGKSVEV